MTGELSGKAALITGVSAGIDWAGSMALAVEGANLVITARRVVDLALQTFGSLDILMNMLGSGTTKTSWKHPRKTITR